MSAIKLNDKIKISLTWKNMPIKKLPTKAHCFNYVQRLHHKKFSSTSVFHCTYCTKKFFFYKVKILKNNLENGFKRVLHLQFSSLHEKTLRHIWKKTLKRKKRHWNCTKNKVSLNQHTKKKKKKDKVATLI